MMKRRKKVWNVQKLYYKEGNKLMKYFGTSVTVILKKGCQRNSA